MSVEDFEAAAAMVKTFTKRPSNDELLALYGLYKQANEGNNTTSAPWAIQMEAKAKWQAWKDREGMSKEDARKEYIDLANSLKATYA